MVITDYAVVLEIPAPHHLVLSRGEEIWRSFRDSKPTDGRDVPRQCKLQGARRQIPNLDRAIGRSGGVPRIGGIDSDASHPPHVSGDNTHQLPRGVPLWLWQVMTGLTATRHKSRGPLWNSCPGAPSTRRDHTAPNSGGRGGGRAWPSAPAPLAALCVSSLFTAAPGPAPVPGGGMSFTMLYSAATLAASLSERLRWRGEGTCKSKEWNGGACTLSLLNTNTRTKSRGSETPHPGS
eukprot:scaffold25629_cov33-Tisochrysis_lutea.AAC.1